MVLSYGQIVEFGTPAALMSDPASEFSGLLKEIEKEEKQWEQKYWSLKIKDDFE